MLALRRWWQPVLGVVLVAAAAWFLAARLASGWDESRQSLRTADWGWLSVAAGFAAATVVIVAVAWHRVLTVLGARPPLGSTIRWFFLGEIGKYLPGVVWPLLGRAELARRNGVPGHVAWSSVPLSLGFGYLTACIAALVALAVFPGTGTSPLVVALLALAVPVGLVALHPRVLGLPLDLAGRVFQRRLELEPSPWSKMLAIVPWYVPGWGFIVLATWAVARAFDTDVPLAAVAFPTILAWLIGFLAIPVPGGVGVREAAFAAAAEAGGMDPSLAVIVAVVARSIYVLVDAGGFLLALTIGAWRPSRAASEMVHPDASEGRTGR